MRSAGERGKQARGQLLLPLQEPGGNLGRALCGGQEESGRRGSGPLPAAAGRGGQVTAEK